jgi:hypothetical protein
MKAAGALIGLPRELRDTMLPIWANKRKEEGLVPDSSSCSGDFTNQLDICGNVGK